MALFKKTRSFVNKPRSFDRNLIVIGAGSAGLVSAYLGTAMGARVTLIEKGEMGGDCLNRGCVPSKALIRSGRLIAELRRAEALGLTDASAEVDFSAVMERVQRVVETIAPHDSVERYRQLGVEVVQGEGVITTPWSVRVGEREWTTRNIIVATGARPRIPNIEGLEKVDYLTSDNLWKLRKLPRRLLVLGTGTIGCELAQLFSQLGSAVTLVGRDTLLPREDPEVRKLMIQQFTEVEGIDLQLHQDSVRFVQQGGEQALRLRDRQGRGEREISFDQILIATGRIANTEGLGLESVGVQRSGAGAIEANHYLQTHCPSIYVCGDVAGSYQFTHAASNQAWSAAVNTLFGFIKRFSVNERVMPWVTFTTPEIAQVGLNEQRAAEQGVQYEVTQFPFSELDRAITESEDLGWIKVLTAPGRDTILGVTIVGAHAGDLLQEYVLAMRHGLGLNKILATIHPYPTFVEINQRVAGKWKRAHTPQRLLRWATRLHRWRRGQW